MKFGKELASQAQEEFKYYYLDYDKLKRLIKDAVATGSYQENDESQFIDSLERELEKVTAFHELKKDEVERRLARAEALLEKAEASASTSVGVPEAGSSRISDELAKQIEDELAGCSQQINKLAKFTKLNYSGFMKILKKHDKHTNFQLKSMFLMRMNSRPWYKDNLDDEILALSEYYTRFNALTGKTIDPAFAPGSLSKAATVGSLSLPSHLSPPSDRVTRTMKFWVHPDNITELKILILKHLPVLYFGNRGKREGDASASYVYFDNEQFDMYMGKLEETPGSETVRFRWFGPAAEQPSILIERKTIAGGDVSPQDSQFLLKEKYINDFVSGRFTMAAKIQKMRERQGMPEKDIDALESLTTNVQQTIMEKNLKPVLRVYYNRTAFKIPGDESISLSLDTEIAMIREDNYDRVRSGDNWRRTDINKEPYPFKSLSRDECHLFPFAVLEVKLSLPAGEATPGWIQELIGSGLLEPVHKFSKFVHGVSTLLDNRVSILPYWLPQLDKDIRRTKVTIPTQAPIQETDASDVSDVTEDEVSDVPTDEREAVTDDDAGEDEPLLRDPRSDEEAPEFTSRRRRGQLQDASQLMALSHGLGGEAAPRPPVRRNKRVAIPVRVEPKVFFANERTLLAWLRFTVVLGGLALGLLNFSDKVGQVSGILFSIVAMGIMLYSFALYVWRTRMIELRYAGAYDDRLGPIVLVISMFTCIMVNLWLRLRE